MKELSDLKDPKGKTIGIYFSAHALDAGKSFSQKTGVPFSRIVENALRAHLEAHGALPTNEDAEYEADCAALRELPGGPEEVRNLKLRLTASEVEEGPTASFSATL